MIFFVEQVFMPQRKSVEIDSQTIIDYDHLCQIVKRAQKEFTTNPLEFKLCS